MPRSHVTARLFQANPDDAEFNDAMHTLESMDYQARTLTRSLRPRLYGIAATSAVGLGLWSLHQEVELHAHGTIRPWDLTEDLAEGSYFAFFDGGVTVMLATGHGPRTTALSDYLNRLLSLDVIFEAILRSDNLTYVASLDDVKRIEMTLSGPRIVQELASVDESLGSTAAALIDLSASDKFKIELDGTDSDSRDEMWRRSIRWLRPLIESLPIPGIDRLHVVVRGELSGEEDVDVLKDRITYQIQVPSDRLDMSTAFDVAADAYSRYVDEAR